MKIVLGLGNPGKRYLKTRHNLGFRVVDLLASRHGTDLMGASDRIEAAVGRTVIGGVQTVLAKPLTFMNRSGEAARELCDLFGAGSGDLLLVFDDADLPFGTLRVRPKGGPGGHRGVASVLELLGTERISRVKLGIRGGERPEGDLIDYVLAEFDDRESGAVDELVSLAGDAVEKCITDGVREAMAAYNGLGSGKETGS